MKRRRWLWLGRIVLLACAAWLAYPRVAFPIQALCWKYKRGMAMVH